MLVATALGASVAVALALLLLVRWRNRRRVIPDELRPVILEEALRRARSKQQAAALDRAVRHDRAS